MYSLNRFVIRQVQNCQAFARSWFHPNFFKTNKWSWIRHVGCPFHTGGGSEKSLPLKIAAVNSEQADCTHSFQFTRTYCHLQRCISWVLHLYSVHYFLSITSVSMVLMALTILSWYSSKVDLCNFTVYHLKFRMGSTSKGNNKFQINEIILSHFVT